MTLPESRNTAVQSIAPPVSAGRTWILREAALQAQAALRRRGIVGQEHHGHNGLGLSTSQPT